MSAFTEEETETQRWNQESKRPLESEWHPGCLIQSPQASSPPSRHCLLSQWGPRPVLAKGGCKSQPEESGGGASHSQSFSPSYSRDPQDFEVERAHASSVVKTGTTGYRISFFLDSQTIAPSTVFLTFLRSKAPRFVSWNLLTHLHDFAVVFPISTVWFAKQGGENVPVCC